MRRGTRTFDSSSNCNFVAGLKIGILESSMACPGLFLSSTTMAFGPFFEPRAISAMRSSACLRSAFFSDSRNLFLLVASSSSSEDSPSSSNFLLRAASRCSSSLCDLLFLLAAASASSFAFAAAALAAFSRSTSESSSSSQLSAT